MRIGIIDTNSILGYLIRNDSFLLDAFKKYDELKIPLEVIFEVVYVLNHEFKLDRFEIVEAVAKMITTQKVNCEREVILNTLFKFRDNKKLSLVDCYLWELKENTGLELITLDKELLKAVKQ